MKKLFSNMTAQKRLGFAALALGIIAVFAGNPSDTAMANINADELALIVYNEVDHVNSETLAGWIIEGRADYRLIDLNDEKIFNEYHIPTAENIQIPGLAESGLLRNEKIILYSDGGIHSAQAWMLLKAKKYKTVYMLRGGLEEWKEKILFPSLPVNASKEDSLNFNKIAEVSKYFGGTPESGSASAETKVQKQMPKLQNPAGGLPGTVTKKKKKEGC